MMTVLTAMMDVWLDKGTFTDPGVFRFPLERPSSNGPFPCISQNLAVSNQGIDSPHPSEVRAMAMQSIETILSTLGLVRQHEQALPGFHVFFYTAPSHQRSCMVNVYSSGFTTVTVEDGSATSPLTNQVMEELKQRLKKNLESRMERIPVIKRGASVPNYYTTSDERILEYDFDEVVFEKRSKYQHVKILHSPTLGNCLLLDDMQNLSEKDINYTHGLMNYKQTSYKNREILILGGGDGGLLHELLKEDPKHVTMVDIDDMVIDACREHLRGACGDVLDKLEGENYEVNTGTS